MDFEGAHILDMLSPKSSEVDLRSLTVVNKVEVIADHLFHYLLRVGNSVIVRQPVLYEMVTTDFPELSPIHNFIVFTFLTSACA